MQALRSADRTQALAGNNPEASQEWRWPRPLASAAVGDVLVATDADEVFDEIDAALATADRQVVRVRRGRDVLPAVAESTPDLVVLDLQIGNMGGMATCMALRLEAGADRLPDVPILMLLDRFDDIFLARRCEADGWLVKPLDAFRIRKAATALFDGGRYHEGIPEEVATAPPLP